jgi:hypothetical protein
VNTKTLYSLPEPSTAMYAPAATLSFDGGTLILHYDYYRYRDDQLVGVFRSGLLFSRVRAFSHCVDYHCTPWQVEQSYDKLVEVEQSKWVAELKANAPASLRNQWDMHHYMIFLDSSGCYEIIAELWIALTEEEGAWDNDISNN